MLKYWLYFKYVIRHKFYVFIECCKQGEIWRGLVHDMSKFRPSEFVPYAKYFYGNYPPIEGIKEPEEIDLFIKKYGDFKEHVEEEFNIAWLKHIHRNPHHWQYWILQEDSGNTTTLEIPFVYIKEMTADWRGAGKAISGADDTEAWYLKNKDSMKLNALTRFVVEDQLSKNTKVNI